MSDRPPNASTLDGSAASTAPSISRARSKADQAAAASPILAFLTHLRAVLLRAALRDRRHLAEVDGPDPPGRHLRAADEWTLDAWVTAWNKSCSGTSCHGVKVGFLNSLEILFPSLVLSIGLSSVTGYALAMWNVKWANTFLFLLFVCAFVPFQIIMVPLIIMTSRSRSTARSGASRSSMRRSPCRC